MSAFETPRKTSAPSTASASVEMRRVVANEEFRAGDGGGSCAVDYHAQLRNLLAGDLGAVDQGRRGDDGRTVLVVVHERDVELLAQAGLDLEALRGLDILEVDAAEGGGDGLHRTHELVGIGGIDLDVEGVDAGVGLEEHALALHDGLSGQRADVAQSEYGRSIRDHGHEVALAGVGIDVVGIGRNGSRGGCNARRVGQRQIVGGLIGFGGHDTDLAGLPFAVVAQRCFVEFRFGIHLFTVLSLCFQFG